MLAVNAFDSPADQFFTDKRPAQQADRDKWNKWSQPWSGLFLKGETLKPGN